MSDKSPSTLLYCIYLTCDLGFYQSTLSPGPWDAHSNLTWMQLTDTCGTPTITTEVNTWSPYFSHHSRFWCKYHGPRRGTRLSHWMPKGPGSLFASHKVWPMRDKTWEGADKSLLLRGHLRHGMFGQPIQSNPMAM